MRLERFYENTEILHVNTEPDCVRNLIRKKWIKSRFRPAGSFTDTIAISM